LVAEKYYAVKVGAQTGIFRTWEECRQKVSGYPGALYKSFATQGEALAYLGLNEGPGLGLNVDAGLPPGEEKEIFGADDVLNGQKRVKIYVDGSFDSATGEFSYGMVVLHGEREETFCKKFDDKELASMRNVAGEIKGAEAAMQYALDRGIPAIAIYHDYEGIARWCLGEWKTNRKGTKAYKEFFDKASKEIDIKFVKVAGHSNDKYNDMADQLAKKGLRTSKAVKDTA